jgi:hypothetical protein
MARYCAPLSVSGCSVIDVLRSAMTPQPLAPPGAGHRARLRA